MRLYPSITVDLYKPYPLVVLDVPQNNIGRGAMVTLTAGGAVVIPENETVEVYAKKPDGTKVYNTVIVAGNQLQVAFSPQMTVVEGILQVELQMIDSTGNSITTPIFAVRILKSNIDANAITSSDDFQALVDALAEVEDLKKNGLKGDPGEAATIQIGTVTASEPGGDPEVTNSGTENAAVLDFTIPRGEPGSMWYQGDAITGTSTSGTVFSGSGIANAEVNDTYLNTGSGADKGNVYVCVLAGNASTAQWAYKQNIMGPTGPAGTANAASVAYDNKSSGLTATNVQGAVDELTQKTENVLYLRPYTGNEGVNVFTERPSDWLVEISGFGLRADCVAVENSDQTTYSPQIGQFPQWYNVITFGVTSRTTQIAAPCFNLGSGNNKLYIRTQHDDSVTEWKEL